MPSTSHPVLTILTDQQVVSIALSAGFHPDPGEQHIACEASAWLETYEGILIFPDYAPTWDTWTVKFKTENLKKLFELKYSEWLL